VAFTPANRPAFFLVMLNFTTKGYIEVYRDGVLISQHTQETKAVESAAAHADENGDGEYRFKYPEKVLRVIGTLAPSADTQAPTQPTNLSATAVNRQRVDLSWSASTDNVGVTGYQIFRGGSPLDVATGTTYSDTTVTASTTYTYAVAAFDAAGNNSAQSATAQATTPANASPAWQTIAAQTLIVGDSYTLDLSNSCSDADADTITYSILSGSLPSGLTLSGAIIAGVPTTAGQALTPTVRATDGFVNADTTISFTTYDADVTAPPVPTGLSVSVASASQLNVTWNASADAAGSANEYVSGTQDYRVYRSTDNVTFTLRTTVTAASYQDTALAASTTYYYKVTARDVSLNESSQSTAASATTLASVNLDADAEAIGESATLYCTDFNRTWVGGVLQSSRAITSKATLISQAIGIGASSWGGDQTIAASHIEWDTTNKIYGTGCLRFNTLDTDGSAGGSWQFNTNGIDGTVYRRFYTMVIGMYPKETLGYRWKISGTNSAANSNLKIFNLGTAGGGQVVPCNSRFLGFLTAFINQSSGNIASNTGDNIGGPNPWGTTLWHIHNQVDTGAAVSTKTDYLTRYGPLPRGLEGDMDTTYSAANPYLYNRTQPSGWPDTRAATNTWAIPRDSRFVIEVLYDYNIANPSASTIYIWGADYGDAPQLLYKATNVPLFTNTDQVAEINLLNYDTERLSEPGVRPTMYTYFDLVATSATQIDFPGGFSLPDAPADQAPAWWAALPDKTWTAIGGSASDGGTPTLEGVRPAGVGTSTIRYVMESWNGATINQDRKELTLASNGGHENYDGNEVYVFKFNQATPAWYRMTDPSSAATDGTESNGRKVDGTPLSTHSYANHAYGMNGKIYLCMMGSNWRSGAGSNRVWAWDRNNFSANTGTRGWIDLGFAGTGSTVDDGFADYDPITNRVWFGQRRESGTKQFGYVNCADDTVTALTVAMGSFSPSGGTGAYSIGRVIYRGAESVFLCFGDAARRTINCQSPTALSTPTFTGTLPAAYDGLVFDAAHNQLIAWRASTSDLLVADLPTNLLTGTYNWQIVTATGGNPGAALTNGTYGRFNIIRDMGDGRSALVLVNGAASPVYVYKIPAAGLL
jgi:chitodextrinase